MELEVIKKLATMARVDMDEMEMQEIADSFGPILSYVGQIQEISENGGNRENLIDNVPHNVLREDIVTNKGGEYTDKILGQAPKIQDGFLKVKQIL